MRALRNACRPSGVVSGFIADLTRPRAELLAKNASLRQQSIVASAPGVAIGTLCSIPWIAVFAREPFRRDRIATAA